MQGSGNDGNNTLWNPQKSHYSIKMLQLEFGTSGGAWQLLG